MRATRTAVMRGSLLTWTFLLFWVLGGRVVSGEVTEARGEEGNKRAQEMALVRKKVSDKKAAEKKKLKAEQQRAKADAEKAKRTAISQAYKERRSLGMYSVR